MRTARAIIPLGLAALCVIAARPVDPSEAPRWVGTLSPKAGASVTGTIALEALGADSTRIQISVRGADPNTTLPWHMHSGTCGNSAQVIGSAAAYKPVAVGPDGTGSATAVLPLPAPASGDYVVNVHQSPGDMRAIACGQLKPAPEPKS